MAFPKLDLPPYRVTASGLLVPGNPVGGNLPSEQDHFTRTLARWGDELERWGDGLATPQQRQTVFGNNTAQNATAVEAVMGPFTINVTCPNDVGDAYVVVSYAFQYTATRAGGPNGNFAWAQVKANGVAMQGSASFNLVNGSAPSVLFFPTYKGELETPIAAGETITFIVTLQQNTVVTPEYNYAVNLSTDRSFLKTVLWY